MVAVGSSLDVAVGWVCAWAWSFPLRRECRKTTIINGRVGEEKPRSKAPILSDRSQTLGDLVDARICRSRDEQVSFEHDLFGDWSRQRKLLGQGGSLKEFLTGRIAKPRWLKAVRLLGLHLLEQGRGDVTAWRDAMERLRPSPDSYDLANDVLLESVIFAANPQPLLEAMWNDLMTNEAELLRRLLRRFLHVATLPNPQFLALSGDDEGDVSTFSATVNRLPYWPYWLPMLGFLSARADSVAASVPVEAALIANTWLRMGERKWPHRNDAASLALRIAEKYLEGDEKRYRRKNEKSDAIYSALLAASYELPDEVTPLVLALCQRSEVVRSEETGEASDDESED